MSYYRPLLQSGPDRPDGAVSLAGGWTWFTHAAQLRRGSAPFVIPAREVPAEILERLSRPRPPVAGIETTSPRLMAILNTTPDSFSDGGRFEAPDRAGAQGRRLIADGADILDIGGESTRPGAAPVSPGDEIARVLPAIRAARAEWDGPISIDTRKAEVARVAIDAGASLINDVSALGDPEMGALAAGAGLPICLMHMRGDPESMQRDPHYDDVLLDVYDFLAAKIFEAESHGIRPENIVVDPGIGFGKTLAHNLALLQGVSLFHALGVPVLLGASRKGFIGTLGRTDTPAQRVPGSLAVALAGIAQGVQIIRVHDMAETRQALCLWQASTGGMT